MSRLATIPHAPIERVKHSTGEVERLEPGSFVNVAAATGIFAAYEPKAVQLTGVSYPPPAVVVQLKNHDWRFLVDTDEKAVEWAQKLTAIAAGASR